MLAVRDPIHGFIRADALEAALVQSRPVQRLRSIHQLGFAYLVFPGAEHSRFAHVLGTMDLAGRLYDAVAARSDGLLPTARDCEERRLVRAAALLHDIGHAPFSHSAEGLFAESIDHEGMTQRLLASDEIAEIFDRHGDGLAPTDVGQLLEGPPEGRDRLLSKIVSGELDVDKMDYLLRDSLYCGVRYGSYDLDRLLDTVLPIQDPETGAWGLGVDEGGVHALEALVMARYYMFTQVYFNVVGKALELHFNEWLREDGVRWSVDTERFLRQDDIWTMSEMRRSDNVHARSVVERVHYPLAYQSGEHLSRQQTESLLGILGEVGEIVGGENLLVSRAAKDPHRFEQDRVWVDTDRGLVPIQQASHFIAHLERIDRIRVYAPAELRQEVASAIAERL
ncbi:MAG: HD domain-containing protein [Thermoanaerobaculia bacterium]|nr:HD domain-containing protein [Thermoanaerobaculia bacterium]